MKLEKKQTTTTLDGGIFFLCPRRFAAFTRSDLLLVVFVSALLCLVSCSSFDRSKSRNQSRRCLNNHTQLIHAWQQYAIDHDDTLSDARRWVAGAVCNSTSPDFVDADGLLLKGQLAPYLAGNTKVYRCPGDARVSTKSFGERFPVGSPICRSVAMNGYIGVPDSWTPGFLYYLRSGDLTRPGPANTFVTIDEGATINDGYFATDMDTFDPNNMPAKRTTSAPAAFHERAAGVAFADGHVEMHRWNDQRTVEVKAYGWSSPNNLDIDWIQSKSSAKAYNPTR